MTEFPQARHSLSLPLDRLEIEGVLWLYILYGCGAAANVLQPHASASPCFALRRTVQYHRTQRH
jgi:hypothetical protein